MTADHPNIVFVLTDSYRLQALGSMDADPVSTPNLDAFAAESVSLSHCVSNRPICSPYRGMMLTGMYSHKSGVPRNCNSDRPDCYLRPHTRCWSDILAENGYSLGYIGKWHLDYPDDQPYKWLSERQWKERQWDAFTPPGPKRHGFGFWYAYGCCNNHMQPHYWTGNGGIESRIDVDQWSAEHETDVAIEFLRNEDGVYRDDRQPFALVLSTNPPHGPHDLVPEKYREMYRDKPVEELLNRTNVNLETRHGRQASEEAADYFAMCTAVDENVGRLLDEIDRLGMRDNTVVIFTSDHGEMLGSHGRMHKSVWYDESMLVPFLMRAPGIATPRRDDLLLSTPDLCPTLLALAGHTDKIPEGLQGRNLSRVLCTGEGERPDGAIYISPGKEGPSIGARGLRTHRYTYIVQRPTGNQDDEAILLFDSESDPYQMTNIADREPETARRLHQQLIDELRKIEDPWGGI